MEIKLTIRCDNAAFEDLGSEVARILRALAEKYDNGDGVEPQNLRDYNGNLVGRLEVTD